jgi:hypothetical protein
MVFRILFYASCLFSLVISGLVALACLQKLFSFEKENIAA